MLPDWVVFRPVRWFWDPLCGVKMDLGRWSGFDLVYYEITTLNIHSEIIFLSYVNTVSHSEQFWFYIIFVHSAEKRYELPPTCGSPCKHTTCSVFTNLYFHCNTNLLGTQNYNIIMCLAFWFACDCVALLYFSFFLFFTLAFMCRSCWIKTRICYYLNCPFWM